MLKNSLRLRHLLMISLGSAIGTGLFFGAGVAIHDTGASIILSYILGGIMMYIVMRALGEMTVYRPNSGSFTYYADRYLGSYFGFVSGWNYWFNYIIVCMLELTATTVFLDYWYGNLIPHWISGLVIMVVFTIINLKRVLLFAECEFWLSIIKILSVILMIGFAVYLISFGPDVHAVANVRHILNIEDFFAGGLNGFLKSFVIVVFSFGGAELVSIAAAESLNVKRDVPIAINGLIMRIIIFYVATIFAVLCLYPWQAISADVSPFVDVFSKLHITRAASVVNFIVITVTLSSFNSCIYGVSRMLYSLAIQKQAPRIFCQLNHDAVPSNAVVFSLLIVAMTVWLNYVFPKTLLMALIVIATCAAVTNWLLILITHIKFRSKVKGLNYRLPFFPIASICAICYFVLVFMLVVYENQKNIIINIAWLLLLSIVYFMRKWRAKT